MQIKLQYGDVLVEALLDIRASVCFIDKKLPHIRIWLSWKKNSTHVEVIDGYPLISKNVIEETQTLEVILVDQISNIVFNIM